MTAATAVGKTTIIINGVLGASGNKWYYDTAADVASLEAITFGSAITTSDWTEMKDAGNHPINYVEITPTAGHKVARVIEVDSNTKPIAVADIILNIGA